MTDLAEDDRGMHELLTGWGSSARGTAPQVAFDPASLKRPAHLARLRSRRILAPVLAAVLVSAIALGGLALRGPHQHGPAGPADAAIDPFIRPVPSGKAYTAVVRDGQLVVARGRVVAEPGLVRFCAPVAVAGTGSSTPLDDCPVYLKATGVDLNRLTDRQVRGPFVTGSATLVGVYRGANLRVTQQSSFRRVRTAPYDRPACAAPPGGWPDQRRTTPADFEFLATFAAAHPGAVQMVAELRPSARTALVYVLTPGDPSAVRRDLGPRFPGRLCVVRSEFTPAQIHRAGAIFGTRSGPGLTRADSYSPGGGLTVQGQIEVSADIPVLTATLAAKIDAQPAGLVQLSVWLRPAG